MPYTMIYQRVDPGIDLTLTLLGGHADVEVWTPEGWARPSRVFATHTLFFALHDLDYVRAWILHHSHHDDPQAFGSIRVFLREEGERVRMAACRVPNILGPMGFRAQPPWLHPLASPTSLISADLLGAYGLSEYGSDPVELPLSAPQPEPEPDTSVYDLL